MEQQPNTLQNIGKQISNIKVPEINPADALKSVTDSISNAKQSVTSSINEFSSSTAVSANQSFLNSNSIIAKFVFLILALIIFLIVLNLGIFLMSYLFGRTKNPYVVGGLLPGNISLNIPQDPKNPDSVMIYRSNNENGGIEATWTIWLNINDLQGGNADTFNHIFNKGNAVFNSSGVASVTNAPGVYLNKSTNTLRVYMDTTSKNNNFTDLTNVPLKKWFHLAIRIQGDIVDTYLNGIIANRFVLTEVPKQNYDSINICNNGGFNGSLSNLTYYSHGLSVFEINNLVMRGPDLTQSKSVKSNIGNYSYMSNLWYFNKLTY